MTVTFQIQIDPLEVIGNTWRPKSDHQFTKLELQTMKSDMDFFIQNLKDFGEFIRAEMYVDNEVYLDTNKGAN